MQVGVSGCNAERQTEINIHTNTGTHPGIDRRTQRDICRQTKGEYFMFTVSQTHGIMQSKPSNE